MTEDLDGNSRATIKDCIEGPHGPSGPQGPAALPYQKSLQMSGSSGCLEIDDEVFNGNPDLVILHTYRRTILDGFAPPVIETVYNNGKWNVCSVNGSNLPNDSNSHYDLLVVADLSN